MGYELKFRCGFRDGEIESIFFLYVRTFLCIFMHFFIQGSEFSSYETELRKMMSHFELLTRKVL